MVMFDVSKTKVEIDKLFFSNVIELAQFYSIITDNLNPILTDRNKGKLKGLAEVLLSAKKITQPEYNSFIEIFTSQNIEL